MSRSHDVRHLTTAELQRAQRDLRVTAGLITPGSPALVPVQAQMQAIGTELAQRTATHEVMKNPAMSTGTEPMTRDPLAALASDYEADWNVWKPGRYAADHRRIAVSLKSGTIPGLADKLRRFTELLKDLS
jgi:hypothetical protein